MQEGYPIGRLAELSGVPIKTIRFYSDLGILPPAGRTDARHRRYSGADLARLQLVRSLRELGLDLAAIGRLLSRPADMGEVLDAHAATLEAKIAALHRQLAVVRAAAESPSADTVRRVGIVARLDAADRRQLLDRFWDRVFDGLPVAPAVAGRFRRFGTPALPDTPSPAQLDAWLELSELAADDDFVATTRRNAMWLGEEVDAEALRELHERVTEMARTALEEGAPPDGAAGAAAAAELCAGYARLLRRQDGPEFRAGLLERFTAHHDPRAERYWELVALVQGFEPDRSAADAFAWLTEAVRASIRRS